MIAHAALGPLALAPVLAQSNLVLDVGKAIPDPAAAAQSLVDLLNSSQAVSYIRDIGVALLYLFALVETYSLWFRGTAMDFALLAGKVAIINFLITSPAVPNSAYTVFQWSIRSSWFIVGRAANDALNAYAIAFNLAAPGGNWLNLLVWAMTHMFAMILMALLVAIYILVVTIILAVYIFAVMSGVAVYALSVVLIPILFPMFIWPQTKRFADSWVSTMLHALFMPFIGAALVYVAIALGVMRPLADWTTCAATATQLGQTLDCWAANMAEFILGIIGGMAAILLMFSVDRIVSNYFPAAMVSTAGLIGAKLALGPVLHRAHPALGHLTGTSPMPRAQPPQAPSAGAASASGAAQAGAGRGGSAPDNSAPPGVPPDAGAREREPVAAGRPGSRSATPRYGRLEDELGRGAGIEWKGGDANLN